MMRAAFHTTPGDALSERAHRVEYAPASYTERATLEALFPRPAPLEIDLGSGEGAFLLALATRHPERHFIGIERLLGRVRKVCRAAAAAGLDNVRLLRIENYYALRHILPLASVSVAHVGFPDPWPKRYHQRRRLVQDDFMQALHPVLVPGGELRVKTDDEPYFQYMEKIFGRAQGYERLEWVDDPDYPLTDFEQRFLSQGMPIYKARLRKV